jgi:hypothetical protein
MGELRTANDRQELLSPELLTQPDRVRGLRSGRAARPGVRRGPMRPCAWSQGLGAATAWRGSKAITMRSGECSIHACFTPALTAPRSAASERAATASAVASSSAAQRRSFSAAAMARDDAASRSAASARLRAASTEASSSAIEAAALAAAEVARWRSSSRVAPNSRARVSAASRRCCDVASAACRAK